MDRGLSRRAASRLAWAGFALAVLIVTATVLLVFLNRRLVHAVDDVQPIEITLGLVWAAVGAIVASRQPRNPMGWIFLTMGLLSSITGVSRQYFIRGATHGGLPGPQWGAWLGNWLVALIFPSGTALFTFLLFPDGHPPSRRWRIVGWLGAAMAAAGVLIALLDPAPLDVNSLLPSPPNPTGVGGLPDLVNGPIGAVVFLSSLALLLTAVIGVGVRLRRAKGDERQQLKWFAYAGIGTTLSVVAVIIIGSFFRNIPGGFFDIPTVGGYGIAVPVACGIAIFKYGLYEIDVVINKTVVVGILAAFVTLIYVGVVVGIGAAIGSRGKPNLLLSIAATALIAVAFQPVRERARRLADRMVYGKRATPYEILSEFSERMAGTFALDDILPRTARVLSEGTGATRADVWLRVGPNLRLAASWPPSGNGQRPEDMPLAGDALPVFDGITMAAPVRHQGELLGALTIAKPASDPLTPAEDKLVGDLASQAGLVLRNARLTAELLQRLDELQASRQRIVAAQDVERRRIERNLHDGAQQQLVAMAVKLRMANMLAERDVGRSRGLLSELEGELSEALETLRDLARGIYPPLLADQGLVAALGAQSRKAALPVSVEAADVARYPQETEAAVYFCCLEAIQNVAKYANASRAVIRLSARGAELVFEVRDDGNGFDPAVTARGSGLTNMSDRVSALGGTIEIGSKPGAGTTVRGRIPVEPAGG